MKLPGGQNAIVDLKKLVGYCLDPGHPRGKHKARVFEAVLGMTIQHAEELQALLLAAASSEEAEATLSDAYGDRYMIDFQVVGPSGAGIVRSTWIVRRGEDMPRLTSCYVK